MLATLTTARLQDQTTALGPGTRAVIWFHGCSLNCNGCIAKEMNTSLNFSRWTPRQLADWVLSRPGIEGVTLSGGDPFDQPIEALWEFISALKTASTLSLLSYTGRTLAQLRSAAADSHIHRILNALDILIDGTYVEALNDGSLWRGSSNQRVHFFSDRYAEWEHEVDTKKTRNLEIKLHANGDFDLTGIPPAHFLDSLHSRLREKGLALTR